MPVKRPDPDRIVAQRERAVRLKELSDHPSWQELRSVVEERQARHFEAVVRQLKAGADIDQRYIDRTAGFFKGAEWLLDIPEFAETSLETALKKAELFEAFNEEVQR